MITVIILNTKSRHCDDIGIVVVQSTTKELLTLCDPMDYSVLDFSVLHYLPAYWHADR